MHHASASALAAEPDEVAVISNEWLSEKIDAEVSRLRADMKEMRSELEEVCPGIAERKAARKVLREVTLCLLGGAVTGIAIFGLGCTVAAMLR